MKKKGFCSIRQCHWQVSGWSTKENWFRCWLLCKSDGSNNFLHNQMTNIAQKPSSYNTSINSKAQRSACADLQQSSCSNHQRSLTCKEFDPIFRPKLSKQKQTHGTLGPALKLDHFAPLRADCPGRNRLPYCRKLSKKPVRPLVFSPTDLLGARFTLAYVLARLEGLHKLDESCGYQSNAWMRLAFTLLFFKDSNRMPAAKHRAERLCQLGEGAAYALLRPSLLISTFRAGSIHTWHTFTENALSLIHGPRPDLSPTCLYFVGSRCPAWLRALVTTRLKPD